MDKRRRARIDRNKHDMAWSVRIRNSYNNCCAICGSKIRINAHHIVPREIIELRWDLQNGVALCPAHHKWKIYSAHRNALWFIDWLQQKEPIKYEYLLARLKKMQQINI